MLSSHTHVLFFGAPEIGGSARYFQQHQKQCVNVPANFQKVWARSRRRHIRLPYRATRLFHRDPQSTPWPHAHVLSHHSLYKKIIVSHLYKQIIVSRHRNLGRRRQYPVQYEVHAGGISFGASPGLYFESFRY